MLKVPTAKTEFIQVITEGARVVKHTKYAILKQNERTKVIVAKLYEEAKLADSWYSRNIIRLEMVFCTGKQANKKYILTPPTRTSV